MDVFQEVIVMAITSGVLVLKTYLNLLWQA